VGIFILPLLFLGVNATFAQTEVEKLQDQISERNTRLSDIEKEIAEYESALQEVGAEKHTLQSAINQLELERGKVQADINYTENKITTTDLEINKLILEIGVTEKDISQNREAISSILRNMHAADNESFIEVFLRHQNISEFWNEFSTLETVKEKMAHQVNTLGTLKVGLEEKRDDSSDRRGDLLDLKNQYDDQRSILVTNKADKAQLLSVTKNEESNYQALLKQQLDAKNKLLEEVRDIESQISFILDPSTIPTAGDTVFRWPLDNPYITQYFGYTKFAQSGAYGGNQHNGMDMGAPVGTKIHSPLSGTVRMIGNTDAVPGCYSWGQWILIDHPNGLSSMFAHLSRTSVAPGQKVNTGDVVGYVGSTGYSTGPHLHYTLYASDGVEVKQFNQFKKVTGCGAALSPFAAIEAYLDPLDYLPPL